MRCAQLEIAIAPLLLLPLPLWRVALTALGSSLALAVDTVTSKDAPDLTSVRAKIKAKDYQAALTELKVLADTHQHADVYSLMGFSLRKTGDYPTALTFYKKALDFDANHKGAREYLGELYVETGDLPKAREQLAVLAKLCPQGCEEREDLEKALASAAPEDQLMPATDATESTLASAGLLAGRLLLALIFVHEGWSIIGSYARRGSLHAEVRRAWHVAAGRHCTRTRRRSADCSRRS